ncbi:MAG TPA: hypothetical protein PLQ19_11715, partial [Aeromicrobium sp.]|nr:hypothetical protein [Aeromicrobium sp.]
DIGALKYLTSSHDNVYWIGSIGDVVPDYILLDRNVSAHDIVAHGAEHGGNFEIIFEQDGYTVAKRVD